MAEAARKAYALADVVGKLLKKLGYAITMSGDSSVLTYKKNHHTSLRGYALMQNCRKDVSRRNSNSDNVGCDKTIGFKNENK